MAAGPRERLAALIKDLEKAARQLRNGSDAPRPRRRWSGRARRVPPTSPAMSRSIHDLRVGLEGKKASAAKRPARGARARRATRA
jgi:hypothetical protein